MNLILSPIQILRKKVNKGSGNLGSCGLKGCPFLFHLTHSENIQLSPDRRRAHRVESFCKGICFGDRPVTVNERIYIKFSEISTSWSGVVRFGFTSHDPTTIDGTTLPRYACPELTNKPGFWAKALSERYAEEGNVLFFYVTRGGDVMFGVNGDEKGVFFTGVTTNVPLWAVVDIYGNTTAMEFVDGSQLNNFSNSHGGLTSHTSAVDQTSLAQQLSAVSLSHSLSTTTTHGTHSATDLTRSLPAPQAGSGDAPSSLLSTAVMPMRYHSNFSFIPMLFHLTMGRNMCLSPDRAIAVRKGCEYNNGYVFTYRPLQCGEKLVVQILAVDKDFTGGLGFGMTAADPNTVDPGTLPDDSDLLLDRPEYWVVNKDVCVMPEVGDELSFHLTEEGEVKFGKNGHQIGTLMHVDKTLPMWAFFDVYGSTQKIRSLGIICRQRSPPVQPRTLTQSSAQSSNLTVALPPPRRSNTTQGSPRTTAEAAPPRPPPPRASPSTALGRNSPSGVSQRSNSPVSLSFNRGSPASSHVSPTPPVLPPKQYKQQQTLSTTPQTTMPTSLPPPLIPTPISTNPFLTSFQSATTTTETPPTIPQRTLQMSPANISVNSTTNTTPSVDLNATPIVNTDPTDQEQEIADNSSNECSVCFERPPDCVIYTCGHMCMCFDCATDIKENQGGLCPICRQQIKDIIKIFRS